MRLGGGRFKGESTQMKDFPSTLASILVIVFAVLPGVPGERLYRTFVGSDWREDHWQKALRLLGFSLFGLAIYASIAPAVRAPFPTYLSPNLLEQASKDEISLRRMLLALLGHFAGSSVAGGICGVSLRSIARIMSASAYYSAWDHFVRHCAKDHWVVVTLQNGETYSGIIETVDVSVANSDRDIILREPGLYDEGANEYRSMQYQSLFIAGSLWSSIATVYEPTDRRIIPTGEVVFNKEDSDVF
jgi:small nuclear ribonucleoprotein (snRNP)-like protein